MEGEFVGGGAAAGAMSAVSWILSVGLYLVTAFAFMKIADKTGTANGWFAFVPVLNAVLGLQIAQKPTWWLLLMLVPLVNIVVGISVMMSIAVRCGRPSWWGVVLGLVPVVNIVLVYMLAYGQGSQAQVQSSKFRRAA